MLAKKELGRRLRMARDVAQGASLVLREGDTVQMSLSPGLRVESIGEEGHEDLTAVATPVPVPK